MRRIFLYPSILYIMISLLVVSCEREEGLNMAARQTISIAELRGMYQGERLTIVNNDKSGELYVSGVVISNADHGNNPDGKVIVQNYADGRLSGIALSIDGPLDRYVVGDSVLVKVEGKVLERADGILQVSGLTIMEVGRISAGNEQRIHATTDNFVSILTDSDTYESTLVSLQAVDVLDVERGQTFGDGDIVLSDGENTLLLNTKEAASFAMSAVPISGNFTGIIQYPDAEQPFLALRSSADYEGEFMAPEDYSGFPAGWEAIIGSRKTGIGSDGYDEYLSGRWFVEKGFSHNAGSLVHRNDDWGMMLGKTAASVAMDFDLMFGASKFSFFFGAATQNPGDSSPITVYVEYSQDAGETWRLLGPGLVVDDQGKQYFKTYDLDIEGQVRFRVRKDADPARLIVDDIDVDPH